MDAMIVQILQLETVDGMGLQWRGIRIRSLTRCRYFTKGCPRSGRVKVTKGHFILGGEGLKAPKKVCG
jgi:hypothetical protein